MTVKSFYSILFYSRGGRDINLFQLFSYESVNLDCKIILFYSILFYSVSFHCGKRKSRRMTTSQQHASVYKGRICTKHYTFYSILFCSILFYSILFYTILFYSVSFHCGKRKSRRKTTSQQHASVCKGRICTKHYTFYSILFYSILFCSILFYSVLFYSILFCVFPLRKVALRHSSPTEDCTTPLLK